MRLINSQKSSRLAKVCLVLMSTTALAACGALGGDARPATMAANAMPANGPQADYPIVIGDQYVVDGTTYTPSDVMNYDEVGYLAAGSGEGITGAHHTLPFPSYVEVTSLETGKTILVRLQQRGPMGSNHLVALSPAAMTQIEATPDTPVRVRRVNPPENHRAILRRGEAAPLRMDTPMSLVSVLRRRLPSEGSASLQAAAVPASTATPRALPVVTPRVTEAATPTPPVQASVTTPRALPPLGRTLPEAEGPNAVPEGFDEAFARAETPEPSAPAVVVLEPAVIPQPVDDGFVVQAAAFSTPARAERVANDLGGRVTRSGEYYRVRTGPFETRAQAEASLANVQAAGYSDARIYTSG